VTKVIVENGAAKGVVLADGDQVMAKKAVVSNVNVRQLFLHISERPRGSRVSRTMSKN